jgi:hypothetical protein
VIRSQDSRPTERWLGPGVGGIGSASFLADVGHEVPTALLASLVAATLGAPAVLGLIEGCRTGWPVPDGSSVARWLTIRSGGGAWR